MQNSFTRKIIELEITLGKGVFSEGGETKIIRGLPCRVNISKPGLPDQNSASVTVTGLSYEDMERLTTLAFRPLESHHNLMTIRAGEEGGPLSVAFKGEIISAWADFNTAPDVAMNFDASSGNYPQQIAEEPLSVHEEAPLEDLLRQFAAAAGYAFKNEGFSGSVRNSIFSGSPITKALAAAEEAGADLLIDDGTMILLPKDASRQNSAVQLSPATGLIGYPTFDQNGISCKCLYNPNLQHSGLVSLKSSSPHASGLWKITNLSHSLSAGAPNGGPWESNISAAMHEE